MRQLAVVAIVLGLGVIVIGVVQAHDRGNSVLGGIALTVAGTGALIAGTVLWVAARLLPPSPPAPPPAKSLRGLLDELGRVKEAAAAEKDRSGS